jgi:hypothetical protein
LECVIQNQNNGQIVLTKRVDPIVPEQGKARLTLTPGDIEDLPANYYDYVVKTVNDNNIATLLYTDVNKTTTGNFELYDGVLRAQVPAIEILAEQFTMTPLGLNDDLAYLSGAYAGDAQDQRANGTHSVAVYQTKWLGKFFIQASLSNEVPLPDEWFFVPLTAGPDPMYTFDNSNNGDIGPTLFNFDLNAYWVRFGFIPIWTALVGDQGMYNQLSVQAIATEVVNDGVFHRVLYKN